MFDIHGGIDTGVTHGRENCWSTKFTDTNWHLTLIPDAILDVAASNSRCEVSKTSVRRILREANLYPKPTKPSYKVTVDDRP